MSWSPDQATLHQLTELLAQSVSGHSTEDVRTSARRALEEARQQPDLVLYLAALLTPQDGTGQTSPAQSDGTVRAAAGLWLKNIIISDWPFAPDVVEALKARVVPALADPLFPVRNSASIVTTTLFQKVGLAHWRNLVPTLLEMIEHNDGSPTAEGAMSALSNMCEDSGTQLDSDSEIMQPLVAKLLHLCTPERAPKVRSKAVFSLSQFIPLGSQAFLAQLDVYMQRLFTLAHDDYPATRKYVCKAFNELLLVRPDKLAPHLEGVIQFALHCVQQPDEEDVALDAAEVLLTLAESGAGDANDTLLEPLDPAAMAHLITAIVPTLLKSMVFSEDDQFLLQSIDEDDENKADRDQDIRPGLPKRHATNRQGGGGPAEDDSDDDDDDDFGGAEETLEAWNLRKCSAATLDQLANQKPELVLELALPHLLERINDSAVWAVRESAVLAFGAVAEGVLATNNAQILGFIPEMTMFLTELLKDENAPVREITCWTLGRYGQPITSDPQLFGAVFEAVLRCMLDHNKKVQEAACSALAVLADYAGEQLAPYAEPLFQHFDACFGKYQLKSMLMLYECIQSVVAAVQTRLHEPGCVQLVMEPLVKRWQLLGDDDFELLGLLECLGAISVAAGPVFADYAPTVFERSVRIIRDVLVETEKFNLDPLGCDLPDSGFITCALDLVDGLIQGLGAQGGMHGLFAMLQNPSWNEMIYACLGEHVAADVRRSALAVIGDMAMFTIDEVQPHLASLMPLILPCISAGDDVSDGGELEPVCSNAMWAAGEIALHTPQGTVSPYFAELYQRIVNVLLRSNPPVTRTVRENAAMALGRLGANAPDLVAPHIAQFFGRWAEVAVDAEDTLEKDTAVQGLCMAIAQNPGAISNEQQLATLLKLFAAMYTPTDELKMLVGKVVAGYQQYLSNFDAVLQQVPLVHRQQLQQVYGVSI